jgi:hypothetical protein
MTASFIEGSGLSQVDNQQKYIGVFGHLEKNQQSRF